MQTQTDTIQNVLKEAKSQFDLIEFDLDLSEIKSNSVLEWHGNTIGQVVIKGDVFYLKLNENAPMLIVSDFPQQKQVLIEAANTVKIKQGLHTALDSLFIEAESIDYQLNSNVLKEVNLVARDSLIISSHVLLNELQRVDIAAKTIHLQSNGCLELAPNGFENRIEASQIIVDKDAILKLSNTYVVGAEIYAQGDVALDKCELNIKKLDFQGNYSINGGSCIVEKNAMLAGDKRSILNELKIEAERIVFSGENKNQQVEFISDDIIFLAGNHSVFTDCSLNVQNSVSLNEEAQVQLNNSFINANTIDFSGNANLEYCTIESDSLNTSEQTSINASKILAAEFWKDAGAKINNCKIKAQSTTLLNEVDIQHSKLKTNTISHSGAGIGKVGDSKIYVFDYIHTSKESNLTFKHSYLESKQNYSQGILNFNEGSDYRCNYLQQSTGSITINGSIVHDANLVYTFGGAQLTTEAKSNVQVKTALLEGNNDWNSSQLSATGPLVFAGKTTVDATSISSQDNIILTTNQHEINESVILSQKDILVDKDLVLNQSKLGCNRLIFSGQNNQIENSQIDASHLAVLNQFSSKQSVINLQENLETFYESSTSLEGTKINANSMKFAGQLDSKLSEFKVKENINFEFTSTSDFQTVKLEAGKAIVNEKTSKMTGTNLDLKAVDFASHGSIDIDKFSVHATSMLNTGDIHSEQLQLKVNHDLVNAGKINSKNIKIQASSFLNTGIGRVQSSQSTVIQAPLLVNCGGSLTSDGLLSMDSILNYNIGGLMQAYDLSNRNVYSYNHGLILPRLPKSFSDVFNFSRMLNCTSMMLNQFVPQYSNVISLGKMAIPNLMKSDSYLRDFYTSGNPLSALPSRLYRSAIDSCSEFAAGFKINESSDVLPVMMNVMSTSLGAAQFAKSAAGAFNEMNTVPKDILVADTFIEKPSTRKPAEVSMDDVIHALGANAIAAFGPSMNIQSIYNQNAGVVLSANLTESAFDEHNTGIKCGWNTVGNYQRGVNRGIFAGANVVATGDRYENFGSFTGYNKASLLFNDSLTNVDGGSLNLSNFHIRTGKIDNNSELNLSKGKVEADNFISTGKAHLSGVAAIIKEEANLKGSYSLTNQTSLNAKDINLEDEGLIQQSMIAAHNNLNQTGHLVAEESSISGNRVSLSGIEATDGKISAKNELNISNSTTLGTGLVADNANLKDSTFKGRKTDKSAEQEPSESANTQDQATSSANKINVKDKLVTENIVMEDMQVESGSHKDTAGRYTESNIKVTRDFTAKNTTLDQVVLRAQDIRLSEKTTLKSSQLKADNSLKQTGEGQVENTVLIGKNVSLDGLNASGGKIIAEEKLDINHSQTFGTGIGAQNANLKNSTFKGKKVNQSEEKIENEEVTTEESNQNPSSEPSANQIKVAEKLITRNVVMEDMQIESCSHDEAGGRYKESTIKATKDFTAKNTTLNQVAVRANDINLSEKATLISSQLKADNSLKQTGEGKAEDTVFIGKNVNFDGLKASGGKIIAEEKLDINHSQTVGTGIGAKNANLKNSTFKGQKTTQSEEKIENENKASEEPNQNTSSDPAANQIIVAGQLTTSNVVMEDLHISSTLHNDDKGTYKRTQANAQTFNGKDSQFEDSSYRSKNINLSGENKVKASEFHAENKLTQKGNLTGDDAFFSGGMVTMDGIKLNKSFIQSKSHLEVKNANTLDSGLSAETMHLQDSTFKATLPPKEEKGSDKSKTASEEKAVDPTNEAAKEVSETNQIKAGKTLTTNNVVFEGQSITADQMNMNKSEMHSTHAKINKTFASQDNVINKSCIESNKANFKGNNSLSETSVKAKESIVFEKDGHLKTHNCEFDGGNKISHHSANHEQTGNLLFKAKNVQTSESTRLYSGKGKNNAFHVQAQEGDFKGTMDLDNGNFDVKKLKNAEDLIGKKGQSKKQNFSKSLSVNTEAAVKLDHMKPRDCHIAIRAKAIQVNTDYKSKHDVTLIASEGDVTIKANVSGDKVVLQSETANIDVIGKTVEGKTYVYAEAKKDIKVTATERYFEGKYSTEVEYTPAQIIGGSGNKDTGGAGVILKAHNKAIIDASNVVAVGKAVVSGYEGVELKARSHGYISDRKSRSKRVAGIKHGKKTTETIEVNSAASTLGSVDNQIQVISEKGGVNGVAGNFIAAKGTDIYSYKDIELKSLITETKIRKRETGCFGLNSKKKNETHEHAKLVDFISKSGETRLHSRTGNIKGTDLRFQGAGHVRFETPKGSTFLKSSKLNHSVHTSERKVSVSSPIVNSAKRAVGNKKRFVQQAEPTLGHAETLANTKTPLEKIAGVSNSAISGYNAACALAEGSYTQQLMQGMGFTPKIDLSITQTESSSHYQTGTGAGIFVDGDVTFFAKDQVDLEGMPIIANNLGIKAKQIGMRGLAFESSYSKKSATATVGISPTGGVTDASLALSSQTMKATQYQNMQVQIKNKVSIEAKLMEMDAANINCDTISAKIDEVTVRSRQDEFEQSTQNHSASTTGAVSMSQSKTHSKQVNQTAGIHVVSGIAKKDMQIKELNLVGAAVTTDGNNEFVPDKLTTKTVKDSSHTRGFGISGNLNSIEKALDSDPTKISQLTTFSVSHEKRDYSAKNQATIFGKEGVSETLKSNHPQLNTTSAQAKRVTRDTAENISLDIPVEVVKSSVKVGLQFFKPAVIKDQKMPIICEKIEELQQISLATIEDTTPETCAEFESATQESSVTETFESNQQAEDNIGIQPVEIEAKTVDSINQMSEPVEYINAEGEIETLDSCGPFNPTLQMQTLGMKKGRHGDQIYNKDNAQYTNIEKEMDISNEKNTINAGVEYTLIEGGSKTEGLYYSATIDPLTKTLLLDAGLGKQYAFNIDSKDFDLGDFGSASYSLDACSAQALINAQIEITSCSVTAALGGEVGLMGPGISGTYNSPTFSFMGLTFQITAEGSAGVGGKVAGALGVEADARKMKMSGVAKIGIFSGVGADITLKPAIGLDLESFEKHSNAVKEIIANDSFVMSPIEQWEGYNRVSPWEMEDFDNAIYQAGAHATISGWFSK